LVIGPVGFTCDRFQFVPFTTSEGIDFGDIDKNAKRTFDDSVQMFYSIIPNRERSTWLSSPSTYRAAEYHFQPQARHLSLDDFGRSRRSMQTQFWPWDLKPPGPQLQHDELRGLLLSEVSRKRLSR
jgi:hypothetical protein